MARFRSTQYSFTRGEVGADLDFRSDIALYQSGAKTVSNMIVLPQGGLQKRRGFSLVANTPNAVRVTQFAFNDTQEYVLVWYNQKLEIIYNDVSVFNSATDVYVVSTKANGTYSASQTVIINGTTIPLTTGTDVASAVIDINLQTGTTGVSATNQSGYLQLYNDASTSSIVIGSGTANAGLGLSADTYALMTVPYTTAQIAELNSSQKFDALFLVQKDTPPYQLTRGVTNNAWTLSQMTFDSIPFHRFNITQTLTPSATTGSINLTLSGSEDYWTSNHIGVRISVNDGYVQINSITSGLVAVGTVLSHLTKTALASTSADETWREEIWSAAHGYPRTATQHQARLVFGGTRDLPQTLIASSTSDYPNFDTDTTDDDRSYTKEIGLPSVNTIRAVVGRNDLHIFTNDGHFVINGDAAVTPTAGRVLQQNSPGITNIQPVAIYQNIAFISDDQKTLQLLEYDSDVFQYKSSNLTTLSQDLLNSPTDMTYLKNYLNTQTNLIFIVNTNGTGVVLSLDTEKEVFGWSRFETTNGYFKSTVEVADSLYVLVDRLASDGSTLVTYLEKLTEDAIYLDHYYTGTSVSAKTNWTGATTLANQTVSCVVGVNSTDISNSSVHNNVAINGSGNFTTEYNVNSIAVGHAYTATLETLPFAFSVNGQLVRGERFRIVGAELRLRNTKYAKVGSYIISNKRVGSDVLDTALPNMDDIFKVTLSSVGTNQTLTVVSDVPLPMQVNGLTVEARFSA